MENLSCCFIGHRKIENEEQVKEKLTKVIGQLIERGVVNFYFGSRSEFDNLAWDMVTEFKKERQELKRIYLRTCYSELQECYVKLILEDYEDTYVPQVVENAGRASYIKRNQAMIDVSDICVFYYNENYLPSRRKISKRDLSDYQPKSGTKLAFNYAKTKKKEILNVFCMDI